jgi:protein SCO1
MRRLIKPVVGALAAAGVIGGIPPGARAADAADPHAHHHPAVQQWTRSTVNYEVPQVKLVRADGESVLLTEELNDGRPVVMNFIFTTCTAICPVMSQTFAQLQSKLGSERAKVHMVSISIDPEQDTPARLSEYAKKFGAGSQWQFYTGTVAASVSAQRAFDVFRGDKMSHAPVTLLRATPGKPWIRIDGFATSDDLLHEFRNLVAAR